MFRLSSRGFIIGAILICISLSAFSQYDYNQFYQQSISTTNTGMFVLGGWAIANITSGAYGWARYNGPQKYFYQMNLFWNTVNLSIAGIALYNNWHLDASSLSVEEIMDKHLHTEKILLINSVLDVGYIGTGFLLKYLSTRSDQRSQLLKGYGNSLILQGAFLFVFDLCLYGILKSQRLDFLHHLNLVITPDFKGFQFII